MAIEKMKLRNKKSILTKRAEGVAVQTFGSMVTQKVYILLIAFIVLFLLYTLFSRTFYLEERGLIEVNKTQISSARGGRITSILVVPGQHVEKGDLLVSVEHADENCNVTINKRINKLSLEKRLDNDKYSLLQKRLKERNKFLNKNEVRRALEIDHSESARERKIIREIEDIEMELSLLGSEIKQKNDMLVDLKKNILSNSDCYLEEIRAPKSGLVNSVNHVSYEVVSRGKPILSFIPDDAGVQAEVYIDDDDIGVVVPGKSGTIHLPDGRDFEVVVDSVKSSASVREEREWDHYTPVKTKLLVYFVPVTQEDASLMKQYDRVNVKLRVQR